MGQKAKWEYVRAIYERYRQADRKRKHAILNEFCVNTGYHRKYAIRLLNGVPPGQAARGAGRPRQMDRRLRANKMQQKRRIYGRTRPGLLLKHQIPVKTDSWDVSTPGFTEVDLVSHSGNSADGEFAHTLNVTDIHTSWTESRAVLGKGRTGG